MSGSTYKSTPLKPTKHPVIVELENFWEKLENWDLLNMKNPNIINIRSMFDQFFADEVHVLIKMVGGAFDSMTIDEKKEALALLQDIFADANEKSLLLYHLA